MRLQKLLIMFSIPLTLLDLRCTPSPKYLNTKKRRIREKKIHEIKETTPVKVPISMSPPVRGFKKSMIASRFGIIEDPIYGTKEFNKGVNILAGCNAEVLASADGKVAYAGEQKGLGRFLIIDHGNRLCTVYAYLDSCFVKTGIEVKRGEVIGKLRNEGNKCYLHYEVRYKGRAVDPLKFLR